MHSYDLTLSSNDPPLEILGLVLTHRLQLFPGVLDVLLSSAAVVEMLQKGKTSKHCSHQGNIY